MINKRIKKKTILLTPVGKQDPHNKDGAEGPILSLLSERSFDKTYLFATSSESGTIENARETSRIINERYPAMQTEIVELDIPDPYEYSNIMKKLREAKDLYRDDIGAQLFIFIGPGLPQMQTCLFLLASSGEIPANLLFKRPQEFVKKGQASIGEIDPRSRELPHIEPKTILREIKAISKEKIEKTCDELGIIAGDANMQDILRNCAKHANYDYSVLIIGETGTGKDIIPKFIHNLSNRRDGKYKSIDCSTIVESLAEIELFGCRKGAHSTADEDRIGIIEDADGGTLFLDEIGNMSLSNQAKLLRVIETKKITRVGENEPRDVNVRFIAATNKDISNDDKFRYDLYQRISYVEIRLPPLRERRSDIPRLAMHFLKEFNKEFKKNLNITQELIAYMQTYDWPGNVRDLKKYIIKMAIESESDIIGIEDFEKLYKGKPSQSSFPLPELHEGFSLDAFINDVKDKLYAKALEKANGNQSEAAKLLGVTPQAVFNHLKKH